MAGPPLLVSVERREALLGEAHARGDIDLAELEWRLAVLHGVRAVRPRPAADLVEAAARGMVEHEGLSWAELHAEDRWLWLGRAEAGLAAVQRTA